MNVYVLYDGDEVLGVGTSEELAERFGISPRTIEGYSAPSSKTRGRRVCAEKVVVKPDEYDRPSML